MTGSRCDGTSDDDQSIDVPVRTLRQAPIPLRRGLPQGNLASHYLTRIHGNRSSRMFTHPARGLGNPVSQGRDAGARPVLAAPAPATAGGHVTGRRLASPVRGPRSAVRAPRPALPRTPRARGRGGRRGVCTANAACHRRCQLVRLAPVARRPGRRAVCVQGTAWHAPGARVVHAACGDGQRAQAAAARRARLVRVHQEVVGIIGARPGDAAPDCPRCRSAATRSGGEHIARLALIHPRLTHTSV